HRATGEGQVFAPNPAVTLGREDLPDDNDQDSAVFAGAYRRVPLPHLTDLNILRGKYAWISNKGVATSSQGEYFFTRGDGRFEQVMAYWGVTSSQDYLQSLGFTDVNNEAQRLSINTTSMDNSFYNPELDSIQFGRGGVDDAEDAEIIWHELGHAIQFDQVPGFGRYGETGAIGEGFGDYWAMTNSSVFNKGAGLACIGEWDAVSYTTAPHCLRRIDGSKTTDDIVDQVHDDGEIWSRALFDIYRGLGRERSDTLIIEAQFQFTPEINFTGAARLLIKTAQELYGDDAASIARSAFADRKIAV
ncbi:MAG: M36 family metallopeptidase, partial [Angustibacter sp.]